MMKSVAVLCAAVLISACATSTPVPEDRFYQLPVEAPAVRADAATLLGGLEVAYTVADPLRGARAILYVDTHNPLQVQRYHYEFWSDQPPRLVHRALVDYLRAGGVVDRVFEPGQRRAAAYRLSTRLLKFEQLRSKDTLEIELALQASLQRQADGVELWNRTYTRRAPVRGTQMHASVQAMRDALAALLAGLQADLASAVAPGR